MSRHSETDEERTARGRQIREAKEAKQQIITCIGSIPLYF